MIDYPACFELLGITLPDSRVGILDRLQEQEVILTRGVDRYDLTNLGALLFAIPQNYATVSRAISDTLSRGWIRLNDPENRSRKHAHYLPWWA